MLLGARLLAVNGRVQREGEVVHLVAQQLFDLSEDLATLSGRNADFRSPAGRGDEFAKHAAPPRDIFVPDLHIDTLKLRSRDFQ